MKLKIFIALFKTTHYTQILRLKGQAVLPLLNTSLPILLSN